MGVNVSRQERKARGKYIPAEDDDEGVKFLKESSQQLKAKEKMPRGRKSSSKRNESGYLQFLCGAGNSQCTFDSLETIDARKSVPFAVLPGNDSQESTSDDKEDFNSVYSREGIVSLKKTGKVLFVDEPLDDVEQRGNLVDNLVGKIRDEDRLCLTNSCDMSSAVSREPGDGREARDDLEI